MLIGTGGIFVFEQIVRKVLAKAGLKLPSSLVSMVAAFVLLKVSVAVAIVCNRCLPAPEFGADRSFLAYLSGRGTPTPPTPKNLSPQTGLRAYNHYLVSLVM